jgi:hypothetical protein
LIRTVIFKFTPSSFGESRERIKNDIVELIKQEKMEYEEVTELIGCSCTLLSEPDNAFCARVVGDFGHEIAVQLFNGRVEVYDRDDVLIFD